jgi:hypothetical protein
MQKWDYLQLRVEIAADRDGVQPVKTNEEETFGSSRAVPNFRLSDYLTKLGGEGWEMVSVFSPGSGWTWLYYFKRPVE